MKVGDLVTCKLWLDKALAVVVYCYTDNLIKVVTTDGYTCCQYIHDLEVVYESR